MTAPRWEHWCTECPADGSPCPYSPFGVDGPLNPPPRPLPDDPNTLSVRFTTCNACEQPIQDGDDLHVRTVYDEETGEAWTIAVHVPACPEP